MCPYLIFVFLSGVSFSCRICVEFNLHMIGMSAGIYLSKCLLFYVGPKSRDSGTYASARGECWIRLGGNQDCLGIYLERMISIIVRVQDTVRPLPRAITILCKPHAREVGFDSAQQQQVVSGKAKSHDRGAHSRAGEYWIRLGDNQD